MTDCHFDFAERPAAPVYLSGPADLVAAVPYLLGFNPHSCIVAVFLNGLDGELVMTARIAHPSAPERAQFMDAWTTACESITRGNDVDRIVLVDFCDADDLGRCSADGDVNSRSSSGSAGVRLTEAMATIASQFNLYTCDEVIVVNQRWRSRLCRDEDCCPEDGREIEAERGARVAAPFVLAGVAPLSTREALNDRLSLPPADDTSRHEFEQRVMDAAAAHGDGDTLEARRTWVTGVVAGLSEGNALVLPAAVACMRDMRRRDAVLRMLIHDVADGQRRVAEDALVSAVCLSPVADRAALATVIAGLAWQRGDGAFARECLNLALESNPDYSLAKLLDRAITHAVPPAVWVSAVAATSVESCLVGS